GGSLPEGTCATISSWLSGPRLCTRSTTSPAATCLGAVILKSRSVTPSDEPPAPCSAEPQPARTMAMMTAATAPPRRPKAGLLMEVVTHDPVGRAARKLDPREGKRRPRSRVPATAVAGVIALLLSAGSALAMTLARAAAGKLAFSTASAYAVQIQPPAGSCHARGTGVYSLPDRRCTPGALNPAVSQSTIA